MGSIFDPLLGKIRTERNWDEFPGGAPEATEAFLLSTSNQVDQKLAIMVSFDGYNFFRLFDSLSYTDLTRDPSIRWDDVTRKWWICHTDSFTSQTFRVISSPDLKNWTLVATVDCSDPDPTNCWAPEWFVDGENVHVFVTLKVAGQNSIWEVHPTTSDLTEWSTPVLVSGLGTDDIIDSYIVKINEIYNLFVCSNTNASPEVFTSTSLMGPYSLQVARSAEMLAKWNFNDAGCIVVLPDRLRCYIDGYNRGLVGESEFGLRDLLYSDSFDNGETWTEVAIVGLSHRYNHGTVILPRGEALGSLRNTIAFLRPSGSVGNNNDGDIDTAWFLNDSGGGNLSLLDSSGDKNLINNDGVTLGTGKINGCAVFDGEGQHLSSELTLSGVTDFTVSFWAKFSGDQVAHAISQGGNLFGFLVIDGLMIFYVGAFADAVSTETDLNDGNWHHFVGVKSGTSHVLYVDGIAGDPVANLDGLETNAALTIGIRSDTSQYPFAGSVDAVKIQSTAWDSTAVAADYNSGTGIE
jgi:hypothetical protein